MTIFVLLSALGTVLIDGAIMGSLYLLQSADSVEKNVKQNMITESNSLMNNVKNNVSFSKENLEKPIEKRPIRLTNNLGLDICILIFFSMVIYTLLFIIISHNMVQYIREIIKGIGKIKDGDIDYVIPVQGEDEFADLARELNEMREEWSRSIEKERSAEKVKNDLITNVAHDLRTPLTSIIGYLELIRQNKNLDEETKMKYIEIAFQKSTRLGGLVQSLFDFTKYSKNQVKPNFVSIDIVQFMEQMVEEYYPLLQDAQLECHTEYPKESIHVSADSVMLFRGIGNIMSNAIKYGKDGKLIIISVKEKEDKVDIAITNYGKMIPPEDIPNIFDKFYRVESSRSLDTGGTGLGLAIVKNIVTLNKGSITAKSDEAGTTFTVTLNKYQEERSKKSNNSL